MEHSDNVNTVSRLLSRDNTSRRPARYFEGGKGLHQTTKRLHDQGRLVGILNGFVYDFEPTDEKFMCTMQEKAEMKQVISQRFENPNAFLLGFVGRLVEQKFKLLTESLDGKTVLEHILEIPDVNIALLGQGVLNMNAC